tara:strand:+ start:1441 stop:2091 length:651 start_codon:yes stop_codon:yes gene_type:complete
MEEFVLNEKEVKIPNCWADVSFKQFMEFSKLIGGFEDKGEVKEGDEVAQWERTLDDLKDNTKVLSFWCNLDEQEVSMLDLDMASEVMKTLAFVSEPYTPIHISSFKIGDEKFILPEELMQKSSFGRYIEAEQLEMQANLLEKGRIEILPRQIAILCKKEGESEKLNDDLIDKRAKLFEKLDMATIWDVAFFLGKLEQRLMLSFLISQEVEATQNQQ